MWCSEHVDEEERREGCLLFYQLLVCLYFPLTVIDILCSRRQVFHM